MHAHRDLEILFPTNYSDSCYRAIPAVAQLAAELRVRVTLLHAYDSRRVTRRQAEEQIHSFFAEAAHYGDCRRVVAEGPVLSAIQSFTERNSFDLLMVPESDRFGLPRIGHSSIRARLLKSVQVPLWTLGARVQHRGFSRPIRNIACRMAYDSPNLLHIKLAAQLADRLSAKLHLLDVIPSVDEGSLLTALHSARPLHPESALAQIGNLTSVMKYPPEVHVATGDGSSQMHNLLDRCEADLLFVGGGQAIRPGLWGAGLEAEIGASVCPVVGVDGAALDFGGWNLASTTNRRLTSITTPSTLDRGSQLAQA